MSSEFWYGMACIPAVAALVAIAAAAVMGVIWAWAAWGGEDYKLYPKQITNRPVIGAVVACAKWTRYFWIPGLHIVICRTTVATRDSGEVRERHRKVQWAIRDALAIEPT